MPFSDEEIHDIQQWDTIGYMITDEWEKFASSKTFTRDVQLRIVNSAPENIVRLHNPHEDVIQYCNALFVSRIDRLRPYSFDDFAIFAYFHTFSAERIFDFLYESTITHITEFVMERLDRMIMFVHNYFEGNRIPEYVSVINTISRFINNDEDRIKFRLMV
jgi:hypothetical protein